MAPAGRVVRFDPGEPDDLASLIATLRPLVTAGTGWVNFEPAVPDDIDVDAASASGGVFSNRGPAIPLCTWTPPATDRKGRLGPHSIGVQHALAERARARLERIGLAVPAGWRVRADNPKRGMVVEVPADADLSMVVDWLLAAGEAVASVPLTGRWFATVHAR